MQEIAALVANLAVAVFAIASMLSVGLGKRPREVLRPLRKVPGVARAIVANFLLVPAFAWLVSVVLPLEEPVRIGLILVGVAAGAPFLIKLSETAGSRLDLTAALLVLLLPVTVIYMPLVLPLVLPEADVSAAAIAVPLALTMLLPLALGLLVGPPWPGVARRLQPIMAKLSSLALVVLVLATVLANYQRIVDVGWQGALAAVILVIGAFLIGYALGSGRQRREVLGLGTSQRNIAAASVVASQSFDDPTVLVMVITTSLIGLAVLFPVARALRRHE